MRPGPWLLKFPGLEYWMESKNIFFVINREVLLYTETLSENAVLQHSLDDPFFFTNSKSQQLIHVFLRLSCHGLSPLIISERQLEPLVVMATMQRDMWKGS